MTGQHSASSTCCTSTGPTGTPATTSAGPKTSSTGSTGTPQATAPGWWRSSGKPGSASPWSASAKAPAAPNAPSRTRAARSATARSAPPAHATATGRRCPRLHPPHLPQPRSKAVTPMSNTSPQRRPRPAQQPLPARRAVRQLPPQPGRYGLAVAHRTGHPRRPWPPSVAAGPPDHPHLGRHRPGRARRWSSAVPHSRRFITRRFWCVLARHRLQRLCYEARLHTRSGRLPLILWTRPDQGRGTRLAAVPRRHLRRGLRSPHRRAARRLLRPRRAGHPQPPVVPPGDHRHHPPRHPRGQQHHHFPAGAADRALPAPAGPGPLPLSPATSASPPPNPDTAVPRHTPGGPPHP